jgi:hypothetical protein
VPVRQPHRSALAYLARSTDARLAGTSRAAGVPTPASAISCLPSDAQEYNEKPQLQVSYYTYWSGLPMSGRFEATICPGLGYAAWPTNDDLTLVIAGRPIDEFDAVRRDIEATYLETLEITPAFADRVRGAKREERFVGTAVRGYFRKAFGPGWALVGDAGYNKDFITAQGIQDAFRDAELCATALDEALEGRRSFENALGEYQVRRDEQVLAMYEFTAELAALAPPPPETQQLLSAVSRSQEAMNGFARVAAGVTSPTEFLGGERTTHPRRRGVGAYARARRWPTPCEPGQLAHFGCPAEPVADTRAPSSEPV